MVVVSIIGILVGLLFPAMSAARASAARTECMNNLRQFGVGLHAHAERTRGRLCSGAFDWQNDGCVTENGWVADLVDQGIPVGEMLCPSNVAEGSFVLEQLLTYSSGANFPNPSFTPRCEDFDGKGSKKSVNAAGEDVINPCRRILENNLSEASRAEQIRADVLEKFYNTNFTASWQLVRGRPRLDSSGNLESAKKATCSGSSGPWGSKRQSLRSAQVGAGPLTLAAVDASKAPGSTIPLLADGAAGGQLSQDIGPISAGAVLAGTFARGPVCKNGEAPGCSAALAPPSFSEGTPRTGADGWWKTWSTHVLQDYRGFAPVHKGICNILMADGSVQSFDDANGDGLLNNGFPANPTTGFEDDEIEVHELKLFSKPALRGF